MLMSFYLILSIGVSVNAHFCGGNLKSVTVSSDGGKCCCDSKDNSNSCCSDKSAYVQYDNDNQEITTFKFEFGKFHVAFNNWVQNDTSVAQTTTTLYECQKAPPPKQPLWLRHCSLTYYG